MRFNAIDSGGGRKIHRGSVPTMGGLAIFVSVIATIAMFSPAILFTRTVPYVIGAISPFIKQKGHYTTSQLFT